MADTLEHAPKHRFANFRRTRGAMTHYHTSFVCTRTLYSFTECEKRRSEAPNWEAVRDRITFRGSRKRKAERWASRSAPTADRDTNVHPVLVQRVPAFPEAAQKSGALTRQPLSGEDVRHPERQPVERKTRSSAKIPRMSPQKSTAWHAGSDAGRSPPEAWRGLAERVASWGRRRATS